MSYATVATSFFTSVTPPLRVLVKNNRKSGATSRAAATIAVLPYQEKLYDVLLFTGLDTRFVPSSQFDSNDFFNLTDTYGCLGIIPIKSGKDYSSPFFPQLHPDL